MALIRYPGSKEKLVWKILSSFPDPMLCELISNRERWEYREPFFGAGAIGFKILKELSIECGIWLNDIDPGMVALWTCVRERPAELIRRIQGFEPNSPDFYRFKEEDGRTDLPTVEIAFRKLALHRTSFSGLGAKAGGPIGGKDQENAAYKVGCRWNPERMEEDIATLHDRLIAFDKFRFTCGDFAPLIEDAPRECFLYVDPPYFEKGPQLYKYPMGEADHHRLADLLRNTKAKWVLSYDDHKTVRALYDSWADIREIEITYTCPTSRGPKRPKNQEIIITPRSTDGTRAGDPPGGLAQSQHHLDEHTTPCSIR